MRCVPKKKGKMRNISEKLIDYSSDEFIIKIPFDDNEIIYIDGIPLSDFDIKQSLAEYISMFILSCERQISAKEADDLNKKSVFLINKLKKVEDEQRRNNN